MQGELLSALLDLVRNRFFGKYRGTVKGNDDKTKRGRLLVRVPAVLGELEVWAMPCVPYAGKEVGFFALPEAETGVWVEFEGGDPSFPIWSGFFWADKELPGESKAAMKILRTKAITMKLDDDGEEWSLESTKGADAKLSDSITLETESASVTIDDGVTAEAGASAKTELTESELSVHDGALKVAVLG
ncbi:phage baseplate assembly protein V [soil metagenome]